MTYKNMAGEPKKKKKKKTGEAFAKALWQRIITN